MPPTDSDSSAVISDTDLLALFTNRPDVVGLRAVFERGMEHGELKAWRAGDAAGKGRIIFLRQSPFDEQVPVMVDHIGAVHHNPDADKGSLVVVGGVNVPVDDEPLEVLQLMMKR